MLSSKPLNSLVIPVLRSLHWLKINEHIEYKILSLTFKLLNTIQPAYLYDLISVQTPCVHVLHLLSPLLVCQPTVLSKLLITLFDLHHLDSGGNFLTHFVNLNLNCLFLTHHCFIITSAYPFHPHHSHHLSLLLSLSAASGCLV